MKKKKEKKSRRRRKRRRRRKEEEGGGVGGSNLIALGYYKNLSVRPLDSSRMGLDEYLDG